MMLQQQELTVGVVGLFCFHSAGPYLHHYINTSSRQHTIASIDHQYIIPSTHHPTTASIHHQYIIPSTYCINTSSHQPSIASIHIPVYPTFHLSVHWAEVVSNPRCLSVIHTLHFSLIIFIHISHNVLDSCIRS